MDAIYPVLLKLPEHRGVRLDAAPPPAAALAAAVRAEGHLLLLGRREPPEAPARRCAFVLLPPGSPAALSAPRLRVLLGALPELFEARRGAAAGDGRDAAGAASARGFRAELTLVSEGGLNVHAKKAFAETAREHADVFVEEFPYEAFVFAPPEHVGWVPQRVAPPSEVRDFCRETYRRPEQFPRILASDVGAVWCGARPGDVVACERPSEVTGATVAYRLCVRG